MSSRPPSRIRALVVDDSALARHLVSQALDTEPDMEVVGVADCGESALERLAALAPDVVVLDLSMPGMDGVTTLRELKRRAPELPVLVFSAHAERGSDAAQSAMLAGADDYARKPSGALATPMAWETSRAELRLKLRAITRRQRSKDSSLQPPVSARRVAHRVPVEGVAIGTSLGGPEALESLFCKLRGDLGVPLFVVQHMPVGFTGTLAKRLSERSQLAVTEARHGQAVEPNRVYLAPGDFHLRLSRRHRDVSLLLDQGPRENGCRPAVDPLFTSAASVYGAGLLACVLTGMGQDGALGAQAVDAAGGTVWVQDAESATSWGMAGAVSRAGLARRSLSLAAFPLAIQNAIAQGLPERRGEEGDADAR